MTTERNQQMRELNLCAECRHADDCCYHGMNLEKPDCPEFAEIVFCYGCHTDITDCEKYEGPDSEVYCHDCYADRFAECESCGDVIEKEDATIGPDHRPYCDDCYGDNFGTCESCGGVADADVLIYSELLEQTLCSCCYDELITTCDDCNEETRRSEIEDGYCPDCHDEHYEYCGQCNNLYPVDDLIWNDHRERYLCSGCTHPTNLYRYAYKPAPIFHGDHNPYYGMELETDHFDDINPAIETLTELSNEENDFYLKEDGSLNNGIEIVTHPRNIKSWIDYRSKLEQITKAVVDNHGKSFNTDTCGCHIHRSRRDMTDVSIAKLIIIFASCKSQITKLAQRHNAHYANFATFECCKEDGLGMTYKRIKAGDHEDHFNAINFANHSTIEFRIFKGTLKVDTLYAYLGFSHYVTEFAKDTLLSSILKTATTGLWKDFIAYVHCRTKKQPMAQILYSYLDHKSLV